MLIYSRFCHHQKGGDCWLHPVILMNNKTLSAYCILMRISSCEFSGRKHLKISKTYGVWHVMARSNSHKSGHPLHWKRASKCLNIMCLCIQEFYLCFRGIYTWIWMFSVSSVDTWTVKCRHFSIWHGQKSLACQVSTPRIQVSTPSVDT